MTTLEGTMSLTKKDLQDPEKALAKYQNCLKARIPVCAFFIVACVFLALAHITVGAVLCLLLAILEYACKGAWERAIEELYALRDQRMAPTAPTTKSRASDSVSQPSLSPTIDAESVSFAPLVQPEAAANSVKIKSDISKNVNTPPASASQQAVTLTAKRFHVTGLSHYLQAVQSVGYENPDYDLSKSELIDNGQINERIYRTEFEPIHTELVPEPNNAYDPNAVKVIVDGNHIGYIKKGACAQVRNILAKRKVEKISCQMHGGPYKVIYEEYDEEKEKDIYSLERDTVPYSAIVEITYS